MSEQPYTPTTDEVAEAWASRYDGEHMGATGAERRGYEAEFGRWLEQVKAEARREYLAAGWDEGEEDGRHNERVWLEDDEITNPYRQEPGDE